MMSIRHQGVLGAAVVSLVLLTGCSNAAADANLDGDYFANNRGSAGTISVAGDIVTFTDFECPAGSSGESEWVAEQSVGTLDAGRTVVTWTKTGAWSGTSSFDVIDGGIELGGYRFYDAEGDAGKAEHELAMKSCSASE